MLFVAFRVIDFTWLLLAVCFFLAFCVHRLSHNLPKQFLQSRVYHLFQDLIRYGKTKGPLKRPDCLRVFDVPKRWFWHFYVVSVIWNGLLIVCSLHAVLLGTAFPEWITDTLGILTGGPKATWNDLRLSVLLVQVLLWVHSLRRLLECLFVSVFSDGVIHVVQYAFGLGYYILLGLTVLCVEVPQSVEGVPAPPVLSQLSWSHVAGTVLFLWASLLQHRSLCLLAGLRTGSSGSVETLAHRIPFGGWFELVSCPHYFAELLIYAALGISSGSDSLAWWLVVLYVLFNQALAAQLCHEFYRSKFEEYPRQRKAFIPFVL